MQRFRVFKIEAFSGRYVLILIQGVRVFKVIGTDLGEGLTGLWHLHDLVISKRDGRKGTGQNLS